MQGSRWCWAQYGNMPSPIVYWDETVDTSLDSSWSDMKFECSNNKSMIRCIELNTSENSAFLKMLQWVLTILDVVNSLSSSSSIANEVQQCSGLWYQEHVVVILPRELLIFLVTEPWNAAHKMKQAVSASNNIEVAQDNECVPGGGGALV